MTCLAAEAPNGGARWQLTGVPLWGPLRGGDVVLECGVGQCARASVVHALGEMEGWGTFSPTFGVSQGEELRSGGLRKPKQL